MRPSRKEIEGAVRASFELNFIEAYEFFKNYSHIFPKEIFYWRIHTADKFVIDPEIKPSEWYDVVQYTFGPVPVPEDRRIIDWIENAKLLTFEEMSIDPYAFSRYIPEHVNVGNSIITVFQDDKGNYTIQTMKKVIPTQGGFTNTYVTGSYLIYSIIFKFTYSYFFAKSFEIGDFNMITSSYTVLKHKNFYELPKVNSSEINRIVDAIIFALENNQKVVRKSF